MSPIQKLTEIKKSWHGHTQDRLARYVATMTQVEALRVDQGFLGRILNFGTIHITGSGGSVATVPLRHEHVTGLVLSSSFLIERDLWKAFVGALDEQRDAHHLLRFDMTGPWAPYDFVQMQFGH